MKPKTVIQTSLDGKVSEPVLRTVQLLIERGRVELLEELLSDYVKIEGDSLELPMPTYTRHMH